MEKDYRLKVSSILTVHRNYYQVKPNVHDLEEILLKICNSAEPLPTIRQPVEPIHNLYFIPISTQLLSKCHLNRAVLNIHSCCATYNTYPCFDSASCHLAVLGASVVFRAVDPLRAAILNTTNPRSVTEQQITTPAYHAAPPVDQEPASFERWLKLLQTASQRDRIDPSEASA